MKNNLMKKINNISFFSQKKACFDEIFQKKHHYIKRKRGTNLSSIYTRKSSIFIIIGRYIESIKSKLILLWL